MGCLDPRFIIVQTQRYSPQYGGLIQHPQQRIVGHTAEGNIAVLLPVLRMQSDKRQHINGCLKRIQVVTAPAAMETVPGVTSGHIPFEAFAKGIEPALVRMTGGAGVIRTQENRRVFL